MTSVRRVTNSGFTLIEVIIALAIASGSLILLLAASQESLHRGIRSRENTKVIELSESKLDEISCGSETETSGLFRALPGWSWKLDRSPASVEGLERMETLVLRAFDPQGRERSSCVTLRHNPKPSRGHEESDAPR